MKWLSWRGQFIEFSLSWEILGLSFEMVKASLSNLSPGFECVDAFGSDMGDGRFAKWIHSVPSDWPGIYTALTFTQAKDDSFLRVCIDATPHEKSDYSKGLKILATLLELPHKSVQKISLVFNGDGYSAEVIQPLTEDYLNLLLGDIGVEMDEAIDAPWPHVYLQLGLESHSNLLFIRRL
ncbi:MAG: hypothetical protein AAGA83_23565 [Cyanobacteria bacterium P01_F01_bin.116]